MLVLLVCLFSSVIGAVSGIGGGIVMRPVLEMTTPYGVELVSFLSSCAVFAMAVVALTRRRTRAAFDHRRGTMLAIGSACGGVAGKLLFTYFSNQFLGKLQTVLLMVIALGLLIHLCLQKHIRPQNLQNQALYLPLGLALGLVSTFLGIGGGPLNLAILNYFLDMNLKTASLYSLYIILLSQAASFLFMLIMGTIPAFSWTVMMCAIAGGIGGGLLGSLIGRRIQEKDLRYLYMGVLIFVFIIAGINLRSSL
ncbi:MAG: sulfite exporter TauE/SafE family protein [Oscillospiraceae bacterium]|nr:sulfite exporter TauE/SafE family protein [Oscillospiraceae bacterium]